MLRIDAAEFVRSVARLEDVPQDGRPHVAFVGRSNVGKSALINCLVNRKGLAGISKTPGKTRMLNFFLINRRVYFVDLPGYGFARVPGTVRRIWVDLLTEYLATARQLRLVVWLLDARREPSREDHELWRILRDRSVPVVAAVTKCDKVSRGALRPNIERIRSSLGLPPTVHMVPTSAQKRLGRPELLCLIEAGVTGEAGTGLWRASRGPSIDTEEEGG